MSKDSTSVNPYPGCSFLKQQTFTELAAAVKEIIEIIPVPTVTSDVEYSPSCFLCCLHLQIPSHQDPQSGLGHHHRNCTQGFPLVLRVTDSNTQVGKREKTHNTDRRERSKCVNSTSQSNGCNYYIYGLFIILM